MSDQPADVGSIEVTPAGAFYTTSHGHTLRVHDVVVSLERIRRVPIGDARANGRVFVHESGEKVVYSAGTVAAIELTAAACERQLSTAGAVRNGRAVAQ